MRLECRLIDDDEWSSHVFEVSETWLEKTPLLSQMALGLLLYP